MLGAVIVPVITVIFSSMPKKTTVNNSDAGTNRYDSSRKEAKEKSEPPRATPDGVIAVIKKWGGRVVVDENKAVVWVRFRGSSYAVDADAGLQHLKGLESLKILYLGSTKVSDAGLEHLKGLENLESLDLSYTNVTYNGVKKLQQALPNCKIRS